MKKLKKGDHIRVVSPSLSIQAIGEPDANVSAKEKLEELGFNVSFSATISSMTSLIQLPSPAG